VSDYAVYCDSVTTRLTVVQQLSHQLSHHYPQQFFYLYVFAARRVGKDVTWVLSAAFICLFVFPFVWTDLVTTISHERLEQSR